MLDRNYVKPIPKRIVALIKREDKKHYPTPCGNHRCYSYLATWKKELVKVTVAVKHYKEKWYCKQVAVHGLHSKNALVKDVEYFSVAGYVIGWNDIKACSRPKAWEDGRWYSCDDKWFDLYAPCVNLEYLDRFPEYKYSEYKRGNFIDILGYLRIYEEFPQAEFLIKSGLKAYAMNKTILRQMKKDKSFHKWLVAHLDCNMLDGRYYCNAIITAYKNNIPLETAHRQEGRKRLLIADYHGKDIIKYAHIKGVKGEYERFFAYQDKQDISTYLYLDYIRACHYLGLDCGDDHIRYPKDFHRWHNIRLEQYRVVRAQERQRAFQQYHKRDAKQEEKIAKDFLIVAEKYLPMAGFTDNEHYAIFIAKSPAELVKEGNALIHCVGYNGYDKKMANEETLIFFVRKVEDLDKPFVTLEYSLKRKQVLQCYAYDNKKPEETVLEFVHNKWLPHANQQLDKIAA